MNSVIFHSYWMTENVHKSYWAAANSKSTTVGDY